MRQRDILFFWFPLFASWLLMTAEGPIISAAINRLPDEVIMLAAMGIVMSLSVTIESPIINLLATSTALVKDEATYRLVRRFTIHWCIALTVVAFLIAYTRLFDVIIIDLLDVPAEVAVWVRPGMQIMVFWSAAIGWRRFLQGILIRYNHTRRIAVGTAVRLVASGGVVVLLAIWGSLPGVVIGSIALMAGVLAEAAYITLVVQPVLRDEVTVTAPANPGEELTYQRLFWFHLPLAATSFLILLMQPLVTSSLARLEQPTASLAAWPVVFQVLLMARAAALALPEVIIARYQDRDSFLPLRRFSFLLGIIVTVVMIVFSLSPLAGYYIFQVQDMTAEVGTLALTTLPLFILFPALAVLISWLRGLLIHGYHTRYVNFGMGINLTVTALILILGVSLRWSGLPTAALALNLAAASESLYLAWRTQSTLPFDLRLFGTPKTQFSPP
jgi:progressive ankylosis protein